MVIIFAALFVLLSLVLYLANIHILLSAAEPCILYLASILLAGLALLISLIEETTFNNPFSREEGDIGLFITLVLKVL